MINFGNLRAKVVLSIMTTICILFTCMRIPGTYSFGFYYTKLGQLLLDYGGQALLDVDFATTSHSSMTSSFVT